MVNNVWFAYTVLSAATPTFSRPGINKVLSYLIKYKYACKAFVNLQTHTLGRQDPDQFNVLLL